MTFAAEFVGWTQKALSALDAEAIERLVEELVELRTRGGRLFVLGVGGSAANASHAVNDFRKLCGIEAYTPTDNVAELTARTNDDGWETTFAAWLRTSRLNRSDSLLILSVGGGSAEQARCGGEHRCGCRDENLAHAFLRLLTGETSLPTRGAPPCARRAKARSRCA